MYLPTLDPPCTPNTPHLLSPCPRSQAPWRACLISDQ